MANDRLRDALLRQSLTPAELAEELHVDAKTVDVLVDTAELVRRRAEWKLPEPRYTSGVLAKYARLASGAERGAITEA